MHRKYYRCRGMGELLELEIKIKIIRGNGRLCWLTWITWKKAKRKNTIRSYQSSYGSGIKICLANLKNYQILFSKKKILIKKRSEIKSFSENMDFNNSRLNKFWYLLYHSDDKSKKRRLIFFERAIRKYKKKI